MSGTVSNAVFARKEEEWRGQIFGITCGGSETAFSLCGPAGAYGLAVNEVSGLNQLSRCASNSAMSAGVMPLIRPA